ncbi:BrnA antitoxin family protein [Marinivivus vitaminiproducens]|uniref:BrnA antitoxin family protein n=1 Tax=Marinivivus vitaminiproducens TaxID=3035935 RepID=UPI0027A91AF4|nr:BrnA antitoxin family protein [Geminicoccaceae bacterium SCSIO 64248]
MRRGDGIKRYSADELRRMRSGSRTDRSRIEARSEGELERSIADDPDWKDVPEDWWRKAEPVPGGNKKLLSLRIDDDVVTWFRGQGRGYQTLMNNVLRAYMRANR